MYFLVSLHFWFVYFVVTPSLVVLLVDIKYIKIVMHIINYFNPLTVRFSDGDAL